MIHGCVLSFGDLRSLSFGIIIALWICALMFIKGILHLWKDECVFKIDHLCRRNVNLEPEYVFLAYVDERQQLPECTCFTALGGHAYR